MRWDFLAEMNFQFPGESGFHRLSLRPVTWENQNSAVISNEWKFVDCQSTSFWESMCPQECLTKREDYKNPLGKVNPLLTFSVTE